MTDEAIKALVLKQLKRIAPEAETGNLNPAIDMREQIDLDSMDILNLAVAIHDATGVDIPEADYPHMVTLEGCISYLRSRIK
jgi:acyl carrier protein